MAQVEYQFKLTYNDAYSLVETTDTVTEPQGFQQGFTSLLKRDIDFHGVFFRLSAEDIELGFAGTDREFFKEQFETFGFDANITLTIFRRVRPEDSFALVYTGRAVMDELVFDTDYAKVTFEEDNALIDINNNKTLEVPASATETLNGTTITPALVEEDVTMKGRTIQKVLSLEPEGQTFVIEPNTISVGSFNAFSPQFFDSAGNELTYLDGLKAFYQDDFTIGEDVSNPTYRTVGNKLLIRSDGDYSEAAVTFVSAYSVTESGSPSGALEFFILEKIVDPSGIDATVYNYTSIGSLSTGAGSGSLSGVATITPSGRKNTYIGLAVVSTVSGGVQFDVTLTNVSLSATVETSVTSNTIKANNFFDALNHNIAYITNQNDILQSSIIGEGGTLEKFYETSGFKLRGFTRPTVGKFIDRMKTLRSLFNLGYNLELNYNSDDVIRVEKMSYFYNDTELMSFDDVELESYREEIAPEFVFNKIELGFDLDSRDEDDAGTIFDIHTKIQAKNPVERLQNIYSWVSKHIGSDLLIEILRRKTQKRAPDTKTNYDDRLFVLDCFDDGGTLTFAYPNDQNMLISNSLTNGDTGGNYRLNLRFMLFNHGDYINSAIYTKANTETYQVINYENVQDQDYKIGFGLSVSGENGIGDPTAYVSIFDVPVMDNPIQILEIGDVIVNPVYLIFRVSLTDSQLNTLILAHKNAAASANYGYISFVNPNGVTKTGWIVEMRYTEVDKIAEFKLIERNTTRVQDYRITDDEIDRITDDDFLRVLN